MDLPPEIEFRTAGRAKVRAHYTAKWMRLPPTSRVEPDALTTAPWPIRGFIVYPSSHRAVRQRQPFCLPSTNPEPTAKQLADIFGENQRAGRAL